jgi:calcium permeable stress-gated cation channel
MALLPIVLRLLARFEGIPKHTDIELSLMTRYFLFQVIHSFLIVTLASGIIAALPDLANNLSLAPTLLARNLPLASNFFLSFILLQGLTATASILLTIVPLVIYYVKLILLGSTPRSIFTIKYTMTSVQWGTLFPTITLLVVICSSFCSVSQPTRANSRQP